MDRNHFKNVISDYFIIEKLIFLGNFEKNAWKHWFFQKKSFKNDTKGLDFVPVGPIFAEKFRFCSG